MASSDAGTFCTMGVGGVGRNGAGGSDDDPSKRPGQSPAQDTQVVKKQRKGKGKGKVVAPTETREAVASLTPRFVYGLAGCLSVALANVRCECLRLRVFCITSSTDSQCAPWSSEQTHIVNILDISIKLSASWHLVWVAYANKLLHLCS